MFGLGNREGITIGKINRGLLVLIYVKVITLFIYFGLNLPVSDPITRNRLNPESSGQGIAAFPRLEFKTSG